VRISAQLAMWLAVVFALVCGSVALNGFFSLGTIADPAEREMASGYAWFWGFLAAVAIVSGLLSWLMLRGKLRGME
jgi:hypothetical protein